MMLIGLMAWHAIPAQSVSKTMKRLADTGQTHSYTTTFGQDADYTIHPPVYNLNGNGTVTDTVTGLLWQQTDGGEMTIENAKLYCDTLSLGGFSNWRLPNCHELFSILNHDRANPAEDTIYFTKTAAEYWWSSQTQANDTTKIWVTNSGGGVGNHPKSETISAGGPKRFHVRAVRDETHPPVLFTHFVNNGDGTSTDMLTNLTWQQTPSADSMTWEQALSTADTLSYAGYHDWRVPNIKEIQSINDETLINPSINQNSFSGIHTSHYWSSTSLPNQPTKAWYLDTQFGITTYSNKTSSLPLLCVRGEYFHTGIGDCEASSSEILLYPNPSFDKLTVLFVGLDSTLYTIYIADLQGRIVLAHQPLPHKTIDISIFPKGVYIVNIIDKVGKSIGYKRFIKM